MSSSVDASSDVSAPSSLIVSDDTGNLDSSWLNANYPAIAPVRLAQLALARDLASVLTYASGAGATPQYRNAQGRIVPAQTDMVGKLLPRFQYDAHGHSLGLLIEPASTNLLTYDRLGLSSGVTFMGSAASSTTRMSVDGQSKLVGVTNSATLDYHGLALAQSMPSQGYMSASLALYSTTQRYFVLYYVRSDGVGGAGAIIDLVAMQLKTMAGVAISQIVRDRLGWNWVQFPMGIFDSLASGTFELECAADASGTTQYTDVGNTWFADALQLENSPCSTSPIFASASCSVSRGAEVVQTPISKTYTDNWLDSNTGAGSVIIEGYLPNFTPPSNDVYELGRFALDAQHYLMLGYSSKLQLGLYLTNASGSLTLIGSAVLTPGGQFKIGFAYTTTALTAFTVNGKSSLAMGTLVNFTLPAGVTTSLNLSTCKLPLVLSRLIGYEQALNVNQLKYLTSV